MALSNPTVIGTPLNNTTNLAAYTFTPGAAATQTKICVLCIMTAHNSGLNAIPTIINGTNQWSGVTWTNEVQTAQITGTRIHILTAVPASGVAGAFDIDLNSVTHDGCIAILFQLDGGDTADVAQDATGKTGTGSGTSTSTATMASYQAGNGAVSFVGFNGSGRTLTPETGWASVNGQTLTSPSKQCEVFWRANEDTTPTATISGANVDWAMVAVEIRAAATGIPAAVLAAILEDEG